MGLGVLGMEVVAPLEVVEEPLFWLGVVLECLSFVVVTGFNGLVDFKVNVC